MRQHWILLLNYCIQCRSGWMKGKVTTAVIELKLVPVLLSRVQISLSTAYGRCEV